MAHQHSRHSNIMKRFQCPSPNAAFTMLSCSLPHNAMIVRWVWFRGMYTTTQSSRHSIIIERIDARCLFDAGSMRFSLLTASIPWGVRAEHLYWSSEEWLQPLMVKVQAVSFRVLRKGTIQVISTNRMVLIQQYCS